jgi:DNA-binding SARP family transcriptional activator/tetratricopeptide (TPR) repeat protein
VTVRVEFGLLGPVVVHCQGAEVPIAQGRQRVLLAALLLDADRLLTKGHLIEVLWGAAPPASALAALHNQIKRLRDALGKTGGDRIQTRPGGYLIHLEPGELDVARMQDLLASARAAVRGGAWGQASALAAGAVLLWRGEPLSDVDSQLLAGKIPQLTEVYLQAVETRLEAEVKLGRHNEVIAELRRLTADRPFRERAHALLMLSLYRCGRQGEAMAAYQSARRFLVEELGSEPGPDLRALHQRILAADPKLASPDVENAPARFPAAEREAAEPASPEPAGPRPQTPHQLPAGLRHFVGRDGQLSELARQIKEVGQPGRTVVIAAISGIAGIGKTALAVHWAHQVADEFPDGQLYANLRGFDPSGVPVAVMAVVRDFLDALGIPSGRIPASAEAQAALYRTVLAAKRVLIVLDNARDVDQVRLLLPGSPGCFVLVTSRSRLVGLAASEDAHLLHLGLPSISEAREMLSRKVGTGRVDAEPEAADELIRLCARLPLALGIVAARAAATPGVRLAALAAGLGGTAERLDALDAATPASGVRAAFSWSCRELPEAAARLFGLLGSHPGPDISAAAAASLAGLPRSAARSALQELAQVGLVVEHVPCRFALHDLLRAYAAEQAGASGTAAGGGADRAEQPGAAFSRLLDHYLRTGYAAARVLDRHRAPITLPAAQPGVVPEDMTEHGQALAWFETERQGLEVTIAAAADAGLDRYAWQLAWTLVDFLAWRGYWHSHAAIQDIALAAAQRLGEPTGEASVHRSLSSAYAQLGRLSEAAGHLYQALAIYREQGDLTGQGHAHMGLSVVMERERRVPESLRHGQHALHLYRRGYDQPGEAAALNAIGWCHALLRHNEQASYHSEQALALHQMLGNQAGAAFTWDTLGYIHHHLGEYGRAEECYQSALELFRDLGIAYSTADTLTHLGETYNEAGDIHAAQHAWEQALSILRDLDHDDAADVQARLTGLMTAGRRPR